MVEPIPDSVEFSGARLLDAAFQVHRKLGPGLLESVYESCLCYELEKLQTPYQRQVSLPIKYDEVLIDGGLRLDVIVANEIVVEIKSVELILPVHEAQLITYLKLTGMRLGFLINFNVPLLKQGIKRLVL